jgi:hypothetical protein
MNAKTFTQSQKIRLANQILDPTFKSVCDFLPSNVDDFLSIDPSEWVLKDKDFTGHDLALLFPRFTALMMHFFERRTTELLSMGASKDDLEDFYLYMFDISPVSTDRNDIWADYGGSRTVRFYDLGDLEYIDIVEFGPNMEWLDLPYLRKNHDTANWKPVFESVNYPAFRFNFFLELPGDNQCYR